MISSQRCHKKYQDNAKLGFEMQKNKRQITPTKTKLKDMTENYTTTQALHYKKHA